MGQQEHGPTASLLESAIELFRRSFGRDPAVCGWAPGRVNLIGEHVDYCGGFVLPIAIERQTVVVGTLNTAGTLRAVSASGGLSGEVSVKALEPSVVRGGPMAYVAGVVAGVLETSGELATATGGIDLAIAGNVPLGAGLSSSASLEVAIAYAVQRLLGVPSDPLKTAKLCQHAEHTYPGVPCGIMDQYTAAMAERDAAVLIDCESETHTAIPLSQQVRIVIADSGVKHALAGGEYANRRRACERALAAIVSVVGPRKNLRRCSAADLAAAEPKLDPTDVRRARHVIGECARTLAAADAMRISSWPTFGKFMAASHASLRDDFEVSCREVDELVERAAALPGVYGARMTGGGFGGCIVAAVAVDAAARVVAALSDRGRLCFATAAMPGAGSLRL